MILPARMAANGNFSDASVERFYSINQNKSYDEPSDANDLGSPCNSLFELQVVNPCDFIVV